ncbi:MAG TPA: hypothetical protein VN738_01720 [Acidothermaceae bacterium]|nr:hypothetical protein [Acidothermaceae bacterium]
MFHHARHATTGKIQRALPTGKFARTVTIGVAAAATALTVAGPVAASTSTTAHTTAITATATTANSPRVFAYYYLWWSASHWKTSLGSNYPYSASPLPLPATLDANGCHPVSNYVGNQLTDVPTKLYSQDDAGFIENDVREAAAAGLTGFAVNWVGTGSATQTVTSNPYSKRLQLMVDAVHKVNAEGIPFKLWLSYKASASVLSATQVKNDLAYFLKMYGSDPAFDRAQSPKPTIIWNGSRKYSVSTLKTISDAFRSKARIIGDETKWSTTRAPYLDGDAYYWSSQNPYSNPQSFKQIASLANAVRASGKNPDGTAKVWVSPVAPGYDKQLAGGTSCTPRYGGQTLKKLFDGNLASHPDAWALISWNEITEGTYIDPMQRYGTQDLAMMKSIIANGS